MRISLRRQLRILQIYAAMSFCLAAFLSVTAFTQPTSTQRIDELTVQRLNVVDANGTLRFVLSNKDRMHPGVMDGVTINRPRPVAGMLFFNDEGDEVGGLTYTGTDDNGRRANAGIMFDQLKQDQTIGITYSENNGQRSAGPAGVGSIRATAERVDPRPQRGQRAARRAAARCRGEGRARQGAGRARAACSLARTATSQPRCRWPMGKASRGW